MLIPEELRNTALLFWGFCCFLCGFFALGSGKKIFAVLGVLFLLAIVLLVTLF